MDELLKYLHEFSQKKMPFLCFLDVYPVHWSFFEHVISFKIILRAMPNAQEREKISMAKALIKANTSVLGAYSTILAYNKEKSQFFLQQKFIHQRPAQWLIGLEKGLAHADALMAHFAS